MLEAVELFRQYESGDAATQAAPPSGGPIPFKHYSHLTTLYALLQSLLAALSPAVVCGGVSGFKPINPMRV